jgi:hypothetical protein
MSMMLHGCTEVTGGAVELSWHLENIDGSPFGGCPDTIDQIRLSWQVNGVTGSTDFACTANHGVTAFDVPAGDALLSVEPLCANGAATRTSAFIAPAPIARTIVVDDVVELHAVVLQIDQFSVCTLPAPP